MAFTSDLMLNKTAREFYKAIIEDSPPLSKLPAIQLLKQSRKILILLKLWKAGRRKAKLMLTPDFAMCGIARSELNDPE